MTFPLNLFPFSNIVIVSLLCEEDERGEVGRSDGREGRDGRERDREGNEYREDLGEPGGEELGELLLSDVHDLLPRFLYFLFFLLFFVVVEVVV